MNPTSHLKSLPNIICIPRAIYRLELFLFEHMSSMLWELLNMDQKKKKRLGVKKMKPKSLLFYYTKFIAEVKETMNVLKTDRESKSN